ncbi:single-stranded DNA-binding protein [Nonomuraea sp. NPDC050556]|uniref:single-stranded DNA-binding protein n=1 Tax=Nonomuraea sp. NPDC050556 TaxID=3364369 RepID=UPI0037946526
MLVGKLSDKPEEKTLPSGDTLVSWRLIVRRNPSRPRGALVDVLPCVTFEPGAADVLRSIKPRDQMQVSGELRCRIFGPPQGKTWRYQVEVSTITPLEPITIPHPRQPHPPTTPLERQTSQPPPTRQPTAPEPHALAAAQTTPHAEERSSAGTQATPTASPGLPAAAPGHRPAQRPSADAQATTRADARAFTNAQAIPAAVTPAAISQIGTQPQEPEQPAVRALATPDATKPGPEQPPAQTLATPSATRRVPEQPPAQALTTPSATKPEPELTSAPQPASDPQLAPA